jgi:hypothetical protein
MQLNIIIDDNLMQQARLMTDLKSEREIVEAALKNWIRTKQQRKRPNNPLQALLESDFVGCFEGEPDLSINYKAEFARIMDKKYGHR